MTSSPRRWLPRRADLMVLACAVVVRIAVGVRRGESILDEGNGLFFMDRIARSLLDGDGYAYEGVVSVFHQPGYLFALAGGYAVAGAGWSGALVTNVLLGAAQVWLTLALARRLLPAAALPAGLIAALHPVLTWHGLALADTTLFSVTLLGWLLAVLAAMGSDAWRHDVAAGGWLGLALLTRPSIVPLIPFGIAAVWMARRAWRRPVRFAVISLAIGGAIALPWALRNYDLTGRFPLIGTHGPESLWAANNERSPAATDLDSSYDQVSVQYNGTEFDVRAFQCFVPPAEAVLAMDRYERAVAEWIRANPGEFLRMCAVRFGRLWDVRYHPTNWGENPLRGTHLRTAVHAAVQVPVLLLALFGLLWLWRRRDARLKVGLLVAILGVYTVTHATGAGYTRVRLPVDPLLVACAGVGLAVLVERWRLRRAEMAAPTPSTDVA